MASVKSSDMGRDTQRKAVIEFLHELGPATSLSPEEWSQWEDKVLDAVPHDYGYVFRSLCELLWQESVSESSRRDTLLRLLVKALNSESTMVSILLDLCRKSSEDESSVGQEELIKLLTTIPDHVGNIFLNNSPLRQMIPTVLRSSEYHTRLTMLIRKTIERIIIDIRTNQVSTGFQTIHLSHLIGRLSMETTDVWHQILKPFLSESDSSSDMIPMRILHKLIIEHQKESFLEPLLKQLFVNCFEPTQLIRLISVSDLEQEHVRFLITEKFLMIGQFETNNMLVNIFNIIAQNWSILYDTLTKVLGVWSNRTAIKFQSYEQHFYLCRALLISSRHFEMLLGKMDREQCNTLRQKVVNGITVYCSLMSDTTGVRSNGLYVGQCLIERLHANPPENQLNFDLEPTEHLEQLKALYNGQNDYTQADQDIKHKVMDEDEVDEKSQEVVPTSTQELDSDDDDFEPFDMSHDKPISGIYNMAPKSMLKDSIHKINYLRDVLWTLTESPGQRACGPPTHAGQEHDPHVALDAIKRIPDLLLAEPHTAKEIGVELACAVFLNQSSLADYEDYQGSKIRALVDTLAASPVPVVRYLLKEFQSENYSVRQRLDILEIISASAKKISLFGQPAKLAKGPTSDQRELEHIDRLKSLSFLDEHDNPVEDDWREIIQKRLEAKTTYFHPNSNKKIEHTCGANPFGGVAEQFFYPLLDTTQARSGLIKIYSLSSSHEGEYDFMLVRIINTLGIIVHCASNTASITRIASSFMEFLWGQRYHTDSSIRKAVIHAYALTLVAVPGGWLFDSRPGDAAELGGWLREMATKDPHEHIKMAATQTAALLTQLYEQFKTSQTLDG